MNFFKIVLGLWLLMAASALMGTTYIIKENGVEVNRAEQNDGSDIITVFEDGKATASWRKGETSGSGRGTDAAPKALTLREKDILEYYDNGQIKLLQEMRDSAKHGRSIKYYKNGGTQIFRKYKEGKLHGICRAHAPNGKLAAIGYYHEGNLYGPALAVNPYLRKPCAAFYWNGRFIVPLFTPSCTDVAGILDKYLSDQVIYYTDPKPGGKD